MKRTLVSIALFSLLFFNVQISNCRTWTQTGGPSDGQITNLIVDSSDSNIIYAGTFGQGVYKSIDAGISWNENSSGLPDSSSTYLLSLDPSNSNILYVGTVGGGIFNSTDNSETWSSINTGLTTLRIHHAPVVDPTNSSILYVGTEGPVFKSTNGGESWSQSNNGLGNFEVCAIAIDFSNSSTIYAGLHYDDSGNNGGIFKSTDGGQNWSQLTNGLPDPTTSESTVNSLVLHPTNSQIIFAATNGGVFESEDGGQSWNSKNIGLTNLSVMSLAIDPSDSQIMYASTWGDGVFVSENGGESWQSDNTGLSNLTVIGLSFDSMNSSILYAGTYGDGVFKSVSDNSSIQDSDNQIVPFSMDISGTFESNSQVRFTVVGTDGDNTELYYKFFYCGNYGTSEYSTSPWVVMQEYSSNNTCTYTFPSDGNYIVVARVVSDPNNEPADLPIIGGVVAIGEGETNTVHISKLSSNSNGPIDSGSTVTYTVNASNPNGDDIYFKWFYRGNYGSDAYDSSPWVVVQDYSTENSCNFVFPNEGQYIVVIRAVTDPNNEPADLPIIGGTAVCIHSTSTVIVGTTTWSSTDIGTAEMDIWLKQATHYSASDLSGTWSTHSLASAPGAPWWERGIVNIQSDGSFQANWVDNDNSSYSNSGTLQVSQSGNVSMNDQNTFLGNLDSTKTVMVSTDTWNTDSSGTSEMKVWVKQANSYSISDLQGTWKLHSIATGPGTSWWSRGTITVDSDGSFNASVVDIEGDTDTIDGQFNISQDGTVTISGEDSSEFQGSLSSAKTVMVSTETWTSGTPGSSEMKIWVKQNAPYSISDLQGGWAMHALASRVSSSPWWIRGSVEIDQNGETQSNLIEETGETDLQNFKISITEDGTISIDFGTDYSGAIN